MFKVLVLQRLYNLSDDQTEFQINDRMTFQRFLGIGPGDPVPDAKTIWLFREALIRRKAIEKLFDKFGGILEGHGLVAHKGSIVDATFVDVPRQRNSREENEKIKNGETPAEWSDAKRTQKDVDARWTKKNNEVHFGYKDHVKIDAKSKLITKAVVTDASVHDSQAIEQLVDKKDGGQALYADSAYVGREIEETLRGLKIKPQINEKGFRNRPLTDKQKKKNRVKSKVRARGEHVFGYMTTVMRGIMLRCIGIERAYGGITLMNLVYNMARFRFLLSRA
jgi:IS5 family transposase